MPRICIITHFFPPHTGGIERVAYEQSKRLSAMGYQISVLTSQLGKNATRKIDGVRLFHYPVYNVAERIGVPYPLPNIRALHLFRQLVLESDIIHAHGHPYFSSLIGCEMARRYGKPFVLTQHNTFVDFESSLNLLERANDLVVGTRVLEGSSKVIVVSKKTLEYVLNLGADKAKTVLLYNGVDIGRFHPRNKHESREKLGLPQNRFLILTVRRLVFKNGLDTLIHAASSIIPDYPDILFVIVGGGPHEHFIKGYIKKMGISENVVLAGFASSERLPLYYGSADLFVLPSRSGEGFPLTVLESMATGLPVIATNTGGTSEAVRNGISGILIPPRKPKILADSILKLFTSRKTMQQMGRLAQKIVEENFTWERNTRQLKAVYDEFL